MSALSDSVVMVHFVCVVCCRIPMVLKNWTSLVLCKTPMEDALWLYAHNVCGGGNAKQRQTWKPCCSDRRLSSHSWFVVVKMKRLMCRGQLWWLSIYFSTMVSRSSLGEHHQGSFLIVCDSFTASSILILHDSLHGFILPYAVVSWS